MHLLRIQEEVIDALGLGERDLPEGEPPIPTAVRLLLDTDPSPEERARLEAALLVDNRLRAYVPGSDDAVERFLDVVGVHKAFRSLAQGNANGCPSAAH